MGTSGTERLNSTWLLKGALSGLGFWHGFKVCFAFPLQYHFGLLQLQSSGAVWVDLGIEPLDHRFPRTEDDNNNGGPWGTGRGPGGTSWGSWHLSGGPECKLNEVHK
ncbi:unnamed protein product [Discosporangium mesarthrocarpum]